MIFSHVINAFTHVKLYLCVTIIANDPMGRSRQPLVPNNDDSAVDLAECFAAHCVDKIAQLHSRLTVTSHPTLLADNDDCSAAEPLNVFQPATVWTIRGLSMAGSSKASPRIDILTGA